VNSRGGSFRRETGWKWEGYRMEVAKKWLTASSSQILWREIAMSILFDAFLPTILSNFRNRKVLVTSFLFHILSTSQVART